MEEATRQHFERLSTSWSAHYAPGGPMLRRVQQFLDALLQACPAPADVLDFGSGAGQIALACAQAGYRVRGVDMSPRMIEVSREADVQGLVEFSVLSKPEQPLPFPSDSFDVIVASSVFEYLVSPAKCLAELKRISRRDGWIMLTVPNVSHRVRRFEKLIKPIARLSRPFLSQAAKNWEEYLSLSTQRHSLEEWSRQLGSAGWKVVSVGAEESPLWMIIGRNC